MTFEEWYKQKNPDLESDDFYEELKEAFETGFEAGREHENNLWEEHMYGVADGKV